MKIIIDSREQVGFWTFAGYSGIETEIKKVDCGDYILEEYPKGITIDRKKTLSELANNIKEKRFKKELALMAEYEEAYILCEFPFMCYSTFPEGSGIPKSKWKYLRKGGMSILNDINKLERDYHVKILYSNDKFHAEKIAVKLFNEFLIKKM